MMGLVCNIYYYGAVKKSFDDWIMPFIFMLSGILIICADVQVKWIVRYFEFINDWTGVGFFQIFIGLIFVWYANISVFAKHWIDDLYWLAAIIAGATGLLVIIIGCFDKFRYGYVKLYGIEKSMGNYSGNFSSDKDR